MGEDGYLRAYGARDAAGPRRRGICNVKHSALMHLAEFGSDIGSSDELLYLPLQRELGMGMGDIQDKVLNFRSRD